MSFKVDFGACQVHSFAQAGEGDGVHIVAVISQPAGDSLPTPAPQPSTTDQHVSCHMQDLLIDQCTRSSRTLSSHLPWCGQDVAELLAIRNSRLVSHIDVAPHTLMTTFPR